jgi:hypothetical protein
MRALSRRRQELRRQLEWLSLLLSTTLAILTSPTDEDLSAAEPRRSIGTVRSSSKHRSAASLERPGWATKQAFVTKTGQPNSLSTVSIRLARCRFQIQCAVNAHALGSARTRSNLRAFGPDRLERLVQRGEESPFADQFGDAVPYHIREKVGIDAPEDNANPLARKLFEQPADGLRRGKEIAASRTSHLTGVCAFSISSRTWSAK